MPGKNRERRCAIGLSYEVAKATDDGREMYAFMKSIGL
jgi:hypothetical protein